jgi:hypothetical protein
VPQSVRALRKCKEHRPTRLLHEWLAVNDYCDWVQTHFAELFTAEGPCPTPAFTQFYSPAGGAARFVGVPLGTQWARVVG